MRLVTLLVWIAGCGPDGSAPPDPEPDAGLDAAPDAETPVGCAPGEVTLEDGACRPAGVPPDGCGAGFAHDGEGGCDAVLPPEPCGEGELAVPGEPTCHAVADCGEGTWGAIPVDDRTVFVDQAYVGGGSDGSMDHPYTRLQPAIDRARSDGIVAVAAGRYEGSLYISSRPVRLWGRCPAMVEIVGDTEFAAVEIEFDAASGTEVRGVALSGIGNGLGLSGVQDVVVDQVWIHDAGTGGVLAFDDLGATSFHLSRSLVERAVYVGVGIQGADAVVDATVVRDTVPAPPGLGPEPGQSLGILALLSASGRRASLDLRSSSLERNGDIGLLVTGSDAVVDSTLVRDHPEGFGIVAQIDDGGSLERSSVTLTGLVVEGSGDDAIEILAADATIERSVIRDAHEWDEPATGRGIVVGDSVPFEENATATIRACLVDDTREVGVLVVGADVTLESTWVRDTQPASDGYAGNGMVIQDDHFLEIPTRAHLVGVRVERSREVGIESEASQLVLEDSAIIDTAAAETDGLYGDGLLAWTIGAPAVVTMTGSLVAASARAGVSSFGATVSLEGSVLDCNAIDLDDETWEGASADFQDEGGNSCGCGDTRVVCQSVSSSLEPPDRIELGF